MKGSSATSARATARAHHIGQSSGKPPTLTSAEGFALAGPSEFPDPTVHAYRKDLADIALAGRVIASHYAESLGRVVAEPIELRSAPSDEADIIAELGKGTEFAMLDDTLGWAWGYAGPERRVGYLNSRALRPA